MNSLLRRVRHWIRARLSITVKRQTTLQSVFHQMNLLVWLMCRLYFWWAFAYALHLAKNRHWRPFRYRMNRTHANVNSAWRFVAVELIIELTTASQLVLATLSQIFQLISTHFYWLLLTPALLPTFQWMISILSAIWLVLVYIFYMINTLFIDNRLFFHTHLQPFLLFTMNFMPNKSNPN